MVGPVVASTRRIQIVVYCPCYAGIKFVAHSAAAVVACRRALMKGSRFRCIRLNDRIVTAPNSSLLHEAIAAGMHPYTVSIRSVRTAGHARSTPSCAVLTNLDYSIITFCWKLYEKVLFYR